MTFLVQTKILKSQVTQPARGKARHGTGLLLAHGGSCPPAGSCGESITSLPGFLASL